MLILFIQSIDIEKYRVDSSMVNGDPINNVAESITAYKKKIRVCFRYDFNITRQVKSNF